MAKCGPSAAPVTAKRWSGASPVMPKCWLSATVRLFKAHAYLAGACTLVKHAQYLQVQTCTARRTCTAQSESRLLGQHVPRSCAQLPFARGSASVDHYARVRSTASGCWTHHPRERVHCTRLHPCSSGASSSVASAVSIAPMAHLLPMSALSATHPLRCSPLSCCKFFVLIFVFVFLCICLIDL